jgi:hypothetical protein
MKRTPPPVIVRHALLLSIVLASNIRLICGLETEAGDTTTFPYGLLPVLVGAGFNVFCDKISDLLVSYAETRVFRIAPPRKQGARQSPTISVFKRKGGS